MLVRQRDGQWASSRAFHRRRSRTSCPDRRRRCPVSPDTAPFQRVVNAHGDIRDSDHAIAGQHGAGVAVKAVFGAVIADVADHFTNDIVHSHSRRWWSSRPSPSQCRWSCRFRRPRGPYGSCARIASSTASLIWSQILSGCPSVTDSDVNSCFICLLLSLDESCFAA